MHEACGLLSFFYEEATAILLDEEQWKILEPVCFLNRSAARTVVDGPGSSNRSCLGGHTVGSADRSQMARSTRTIPGRFDLLASVAEWEEQGIWLAKPGKSYCPCWTSADCWIGKKPFSTPHSSPRKRGLGSRQNTSRERYEVHGGGRRQGRTCRSATCVRADCRMSARGEHAPAGEGSRVRVADARAPICAESLPIEATTPMLENAVQTAWDGVDCPLPKERPQSPIRGQTQAAPLPKALENRTHQRMAAKLPPHPSPIRPHLTVFQGFFHSPA
jgi:hypothetical protein